MSVGPNACNDPTLKRKLYPEQPNANLLFACLTQRTLQVVGHVKTVIILMGGCLFFGDEMPLKKLAGISVAMVGIVWYSQVSLLLFSANA